MEELKVYIIKKLFRRSYWGNRYLNFDDIINPKIPRKGLTQALKELVKDGLVFFKKGDRSSVFRYSLNPKMKKEIEEMIMEEFS